MTNETVNGIIKEIKEGLNREAASNKDEIRVMRAMLNDKEYKVDIYSENGIEGQICPSAEARSMISSVIANTTKISTKEAEALAEDYEFKRSEAIAMVNISKEFINTYIETGRKLPLGGRAKSDVSLLKKEINKVTTRRYPKKVGVDANGKGIYEKGVSEVQPHNTIKVIGGCPEWLK